MVTSANVQMKMVYVDMFRQWAAMARGTSYWHLRQGCGRAFQPGSLDGYFNDLTSKALYPGKVDEFGIPLDNVRDRSVYWPTTVLQKALAHWDLHLQSQADREVHLKTFFTLVEWLLQTQDSFGAWAHPVPLHPNALSRYSCMAQGQAASVLARAWSLTGDPRCLSAAWRSLEIMLTPVDAGGCSRYTNAGLQLDEYPSTTGGIVLNGWIFALFGIYDYLIADHDDMLENCLEQTLRTIVAQLPLFDCGYWSLYDSCGTIASPFYHELHVAQLRSLALTFPGYQRPITEIVWRFEEYSRGRVNKSWAIVRKATQKLLHPPANVLRLR